jgi:uncharacterized protein YfdQ (DUF2303 family)
MAEKTPPAPQPPTLPTIAAGVLPEMQELITRYFEPRVVALTLPNQREGAVIVTPEGMNLRKLDDYVTDLSERPKRRIGTATFVELDSFIGHVNRFKDQDSAVFVSRDRAQPSAVCLLDYHRAGAEGLPRFGTHRSVYKPPLSDEWKAWSLYDGKTLDQDEFAAFLEDRILDVRAQTLPTDQSLIGDLSEADRRFLDLAALLQGTWATPHQLVTLSRGLKTTVVEEIHETVSLSDSQGSNVFTREIRGADGKSKIAVPNLFMICVPVFRQGQWYNVAVQLRYRPMPGGKGVKWRYDLYRTDAVFDHVITDMMTKILEQTSLDIFVGSPEQ